NAALAARQNTAIFRCHLGQRLQRLIERLRHMVNEGRGFHAAEASGGELIICTQTINWALGLSNGRARELVTLRYSCPFIAGGTFLSYLAKQTRLWGGVEDVTSNESRCSCLSGRRHSGRRPDVG